jgi:hypothetical protein
VWRRCTTPDPRIGVAIELGGRDPGNRGDIVGVSEGLSGEGFAAEEPPPAFLQVEPAGVVVSVDPTSSSC